MRPFEIPYNFDIKLIDFLKIYTNIDIHSIYCPPFPKDYKSAKLYYLNTYNLIPTTLQEYEYHIKYINKNFPNKLMLLLQQNDMLLSEKLLNYYIDLGFTKFCVGSIEQANIIKEKDINYEITGSITMKIDKNKLQTNNYYNFDNFVLWFPFNRNIKAIKQLPNNFKYILLINCGCSIKCNGTLHWLAKTPKEEANAVSYCPRIIDDNFTTRIVIPEYDLQLFEPYVNYFKLQGRDYATNQLINDIVRYTNPINNLLERKLIRNYNINQIYNIK